MNQDWVMGDKVVNVSKTPVICAVINVTPDSFYDGGQFKNEKEVVKRVYDCLKEGADYIELGGKSTRPGFVEISASKEWNRLKTKIEAIKRDIPEAVISVDTDNVEVMHRCLDAGVSIINDVNGFVGEAKEKLLSDYKPTIVTMLNARIHNDNGSMVDYFKKEIERLKNLGLSLNKIAIDPGVGFLREPKDKRESLRKIASYPELSKLGVAIMIAISMKRFLENFYGIKLKDRLIGTLLFEQLMVLDGGGILRVHNVKDTRLMLDILNDYRKLRHDIQN